LTLSHHELCFGCGSANLFGLQMEIEPMDGNADAVSGRFFLKQDHQGPPGLAHGGVLSAALDEAMAMVLLAKDVYALTRRLEVDLLAPAPVGVFLQVDAWVEAQEGDELHLRATARDESRVVAQASGLFTKVRT
jgi:acyl-coenzyme A thioesterase PaaI-like protein